LNSVSPK
jgi:RNA-directed DNA polymerase